MLKPRYSDYDLECGIDEAGRGCLAGPVTAAAVILKANFKHDLINDSKNFQKSKEKNSQKQLKKIQLLTVFNLLTLEKLMKLIF